MLTVDSVGDGLCGFGVGKAVVVHGRLLMSKLQAEGEKNKKRR